jgi:hypothetical protein
MVIDLTVFGSANVMVLACLAESSTGDKAGKITVHHYVDVGVNFPYYVLARTDLRIGPFAGHDRAYAEIHQKYGRIDMDWESVPRIGDVWRGWLWRVGSSGPYESARQTTAYIHSE